MCAAYAITAASLPTALTQAQAHPTPFERDTLASATYAEAVAFYSGLAAAYPGRCRLDTLGVSDAGVPLYAFSVGLPPDRGTPVFFVNNGIHAGEPAGVDASMLVARWLATDPAALGGWLDSAAVVIVPAYNVGGMLDRGGGTRANQVGPREYGFRGNAHNLDLNRDFAKQDSRNARALTRLLRRLQPDFFVDTHTTNGADYAYALTVIATQPDKLGPVLGPYLRDTVLPALYAGVEAAGYPVSPYVYSPAVPQETGILPFVDSPRYSSGYVALLHGLGFITEAHMLKPFATRVRATEAFLRTALGFWAEHRDDIARRRTANREALFAADGTDLAWAVDSARADTLTFRGYAVVREASAVTGAERLRYDRDRPTTTPTPYYSRARSVYGRPTPRAYVIPRGWAADLLPLLEVGGVQPARALPADTLIEVEAGRIADYTTVDAPYEGHYLHSGVSVDWSREPYRVEAGDYLLELTPANHRLATAMLEPAAPDSYFAWNTFDAYLQRKEHYSDYVFEDTAAQLLADDPQLRAAFSRKRDRDEGFRQNPRAQLDWLYERSGRAEEAYLRYPILRIAR